jgi:hypothetical protein
MEQLELVAWNDMDALEYAQISRAIRNSYYILRTLRGGRFGQARARKEYRRVAILKNKLLLAGKSKREVLDLLACCRLRCPAVKQPFLYCPHCNQGRLPESILGGGVWAARPMQAA